MLATRLILLSISSISFTKGLAINRRATLPTGWSYSGCYVDNTAGRIVINQQPDNQQLTVESCVSICANAGYTVAGLEYGVQCFCDNYIRNGGYLASADTQCGITCGGNANEKCGDGNRMSIYTKGTPQKLGIPTTQKTGLPGSWQYQGCYTDNGAQTGRTLQYQLILPNTNQASTCLSQCQRFGYNAGGMEYGEECYCGDASEPFSVGSTLASESDCGTVCSGNSTTLCGGGNRISLYKWMGTPLQVYNYPSGNAAGAYQAFGTAPVVALITTSGINGKITMVEKYGTSETPGSTGAYELDPVTGAFRTMHVKTDVFCSAGLTLPDKTGRQINIGGWSGTSLFGIRIYWPGGPTNDWQENENELTLQVGRWYPSAMILSNGSIVVVGGENGSNGPAVPSLEILPRQGPVITQDFLQRTNPFNLYPYLAVMPSGGMFIGYYNEARLLDQGSFTTTKVLPNMPGAVNDATGGRTYPLEGSMMLMPQYAPYTDYITVLICGGSTPGGGYAIDNCVSIQPDNPKPSWKIEKMPSKRVMSCMTALPDGTYLILNGGAHGVAGFGLGSLPNHNAILYDPSKPTNHRMSIMANTTIDRLYHSESVLMSDGRVLVSGSDPQTPGFNEERRLEVFVPPYRLSGATPPTFVINNKDWTYNQQITVTVKLPNGGPVRFSLLGVASSTHGNSMGQRTLFPAVSCAGNSCTITAPPNSFVCPPGWFQLFLLDGPTPSFATYVRIGGDPSKLGNWPPYSDFDKPGA